MRCLLNTQWSDFCNYASKKNDIPRNTIGYWVKKQSTFLKKTSCKGRVKYVEANIS
jgi:hypothetical protein